MKRDFYEVLGVARDADSGAIKKAYRVLALKFHPDRNPDDPAAEESFKEATEAYQVLTDPAKRERYDRYGHAGLGGAGMGPGMDFDLHDALRSFMRDFGDAFGGGFGEPREPGRGQDRRLRLRIGLREAYTGATRTLKLRHPVTCTTCGGSGSADDGEPDVCPTCQGHGKVRRVQRSFLGQFVNVGICPDCGGSGRFIRNACPDCRGEGRVAGEDAVEVEIPAGVDDGDYLTLRGRGDAGARGAPPGDLVVVFEVEPLEGFERHGKDLLREIGLGPARAALGGKLDVPTLDGTATLTVPAGVQHGTLLRLKGKGMPELRRRKRGDLFVRVLVEVPERVKGDLKELYERILEHEEGGS